MSVTITDGRVRRLIESGLRGLCRPTERVSTLRRRARSVDDLTLTRLERRFFGLADKTRLKILKLIAKEELCACEVMTALDLTQPNTSHHLGILERAGLVSSRRKGKWVFYRVADPKVSSLLGMAAELGKASP